jgi:hypothetical protein
MRTPAMLLDQGGGKSFGLDGLEPAPGENAADSTTASSTFPLYLSQSPSTPSLKTKFIKSLCALAPDFALA